MRYEMQKQKPRVWWELALQIQQMAGFTAPVLVSATTTTFKTGGALWVGATSRRFQLYEVEFGQTGTLSTSVDCQCHWNLSRISTTATMTGTPVPAGLLDPADVAAVTQFMNAQTAEPTYTLVGTGLDLKVWAINQRGSYRWRALDDGDNVINAATNPLGLGLRVLSSNFNASAIGSLSFIER